jgi:hypothetical protein
MDNYLFNCSFEFEDFSSTKNFFQYSEHYDDDFLTHKIPLLEEISTNVLSASHNIFSNVEKENNNNNNDSNNIFQTKKNNRGRRKQNKNYKNKPKKSWDDKMNIWKSIRVRINKYLFQKLNMLSKQYHFTNFYKFDGKISIKKDVNEKLLNGTIKNYIINSGISGNYNKKRKIEENKNINGLDNSNLIKNVLIHENSLNNNKPFTKFINMKFKKFYFNIFLEDNSNNNLNENNKNLKNFYQYIKDYNEERKKIYIEVAQNIYNIYENMTEKKKISDYYK